jgi:hypothetical protein
MFYAAINSRSTETSVGFANTWGVIGFATKTMRDAYVARATDLATKSITSKEVGKYDARLGQISYYDANGDLMEHTQHGEFMSGHVRIDPVSAEVVDSWRFHSA